MNFALKLPVARVQPTIITISTASPLAKHMHARTLGSLELFNILGFPST